jgi:hypothetical protein
MASVVDSYLALAEQDPAGVGSTGVEERATALEVLVALHTAFYEVLERRLGDDGLTDAHRPLIPLFRRWMESARQMVEQARELRSKGRPIAGIDPLVCAINRAKIPAESFDHFVELNERMKRGEPGTYAPWPEVVRELRAERQSGR